MPHTGLGPPDQNLLPPRRPERALAIAALGSVLFLKPFLDIFDKGGTTMVWGVPLLYAYLFIAWTLVILLTALVMENRSDHTQHGADEDQSGSGGTLGEHEPGEHRARSERA